MFRNTRGFTLIELLVVIAIIGVLSSVVLASLNTARIKARDTKRIADMNQLQLALELYHNANNAYPAYTTSFVATNLTALVPTYISALPRDPQSPRSPSDTEYRYCSDASGQITLAYTETVAGWCGKGSGSPCGWGVYLRGGSQSTCR